MSQEQPPANAPFVPPPPPPSITGNPMYPENVLVAKAAEAASDAKTALILSLVGLVCFGFIFGIIAFKKANNALDIIKLYEVAQDKQTLATVAKVIGILDIIGWVIALIARIALS